MLPLALLALWVFSPNEMERVEYVVTQLVESGWTRQEAELLFRDSRLRTYPRPAVQPRQIDWDQVIARLVDTASVQRGSQFFERYRETLEKAESQFGVDKHVVVAVLRMESDLGQNVGSYETFNVFYTFLVGSEEERRWRWAAENLVSLAGYCKAAGEDCFQMKGSYAGAMGPAQFLPHSVQQWGVDGDGDGRINPYQMDDAIFSAANFLIVHGWHEDQTQALGRYYGSSNGYPRAVLSYAEALREASNPAAAQERE